MAMGLYTLVPFLGPVIGPVAGGWIAEKSRWQWVFWSTSIFDGFVQILGFLCLEESTCFDFTVYKFIDHP